MSEVYRIVTPKQLKEGYKQYHRDQVPNVTQHQFKVLEKLPDGNYLVVNPEGPQP